MDKKKTGRGHFTGSLGFVMAAAGSAIGLGNLWKFPYVAGISGGGLFIVFYLIFALVLGIPIMLSEMAVGRKTQLNAIGAFRSIDKKWSFVGVLEIACAFIILSYYSVVGGWVMKYIGSYLTGANVSDGAAFDTFVSSPVQPVIWHLLFMAVAVIVVIGGVQKGIETCSKWLLPLLFVLLIGVVVRSVTLPGSTEGLKFLFVPDTALLSDPKALIDSIVLAMGQVFFSLSLGLGIAITYGSYLKKDTDITKDTCTVVGLDTLMALLAGMAIMPAVFSFGMEPTGGPGLIFKTLPAVFDSRPLGRFFGLAFFFLVFIAALTSAIALLEVVASFFIDTFHWRRRTATLVMGGLMALIGVFASLSMGPLSGFTIGGMNLFDAMGFLTDKILMPLAALATCLFVGHVWGVGKVTEEVERCGKRFVIRRVYGFLIRWVAPILIAVIFVMGLIGG